jgi:hypothetical protein
MAGSFWWVVADGLALRAGGHLVAQIYVEIPSPVINSEIGLANRIGLVANVAVEQRAAGDGQRQPGHLGADVDGLPGRGDLDYLGNLRNSHNYLIISSHRKTILPPQRGS